MALSTEEKTKILDGSTDEVLEAFLSERYSKSERQQDTEILANAEHLDVNTVMTKLAQHIDTAEPVVDKQPDEDEEELAAEIGERYREFIELVEAYQKIKLERAGHKEKLQKLEDVERAYHESTRSLGNATTSDLRNSNYLSREKATIVDELAKLAELREGVLDAFSKISDPVVRGQIYEYFHNHLDHAYDSEGLSGVILVEETREGEANLPGNIGAIAKPAIEDKPKAVEGAGNMIDGLVVDGEKDIQEAEAIVSKPSPVPPNIKPGEKIEAETAQTEEAVPAVVIPDAEPVSAVPKPDAVDMIKIGPDGNIAANSTTSVEASKFSEDPIPPVDNLVVENIATPASPITPEAAANPANPVAVQNFTAPETEKEGFFNRLFRGGNKPVDQISTEVPVDKYGAVEAIAGNKDLVSSNIFEFEKSLNPENK